MSIKAKRFSAKLTVFTMIALCGGFAASAQNFQATIKISAAEKIEIEGNIGEAEANFSWTFLDSATGAGDLAARVGGFELFGEQNRLVKFRKLMTGEYLAEAKASRFKYSVELKPPPKQTARAHVSWLTDEEQGILMLDDLLPQRAANENKTARINLELPDGWKIISGERKSGENEYSVENYEKSVFAVGRNWREIETANLKLAISGEWQFSDSEAADAANEIYEQYRRLFGAPPTGNRKAQIFLIRLPKNALVGIWSAETRGANVTIASADMPFKAQSIQRLHEQLRHEIFHLWLPNRLALTGNYDWFYEGFAVYQALRAGVRMNRIRFEDFLATLAEAYQFDSFEKPKTSLVEQSRTRRSGENSRVYTRGMLVAFLADARLLQTSKGKRSVETILRETYQKHRVPNLPTDGNQAILDILKNYAELDSLVKDYVAGTNEINWKTDLETFGIESVEENSTVRLLVGRKLNNRQKDLLNELGYNNWRKISEERK